MHPKWVIRHGAAIGLREVLRSQASSAAITVNLKEKPSGWSIPGKSSTFPQISILTISGLREIKIFKINEIIHNLKQNQKWLEECIQTLISVLVLDRMGDYMATKVF